MKNADIVKAFIEGRIARTQHLSTDGVRLYSYAMLIAVREPGGIVLVDHYERPTQTTKVHCSTVMSVVIKVGVSFREVRHQELKRLASIL